MLDAADDEVHVFVEVAASLRDHVHLKGLAPRERGTLQVEGGVVVVHDLEQTAIVLLQLACLHLLAEVLAHVVGHGPQLVVDSHDHDGLIGTEGLLGQVAALVVE